MNYLERDTYGIYKTNVTVGPDMRHGPGPELMGADTLDEIPVAFQDFEKRAQFHANSWRVKRKTSE